MSCLGHKEQKHKYLLLHVLPYLYVHVYIYTYIYVYMCAYIHYVYLHTRIGEGNGTHSSTLAWKIPWTEEPGRLQSMGSLRVGHD